MTGDKNEIELTPEQRTTYCPRLWREIFITEDGNVYACCHSKPKPLGNINDKPLSEIYNDQQFQSVRRKSLSGKLRCYRGCNLLKEQEFENPISSLTASYDTLKKLKIQFGQDCNINCVMCYQNKNKRGNPSISLEALKRNVDLEPFDVIDMQGGEPLFIKSGRDFYNYAAEQGKKLSFVTNGLTMNEQWARKIVRHSPAYHVSLNAATKATHEAVNLGSRWEQVIKNIQLLGRLREEEGSNISIKGHFTIIMKNCHEIPLFIDTFKDLGLDRIDFGYDPRFPFYLALKPSFKAKLKHDVTQAFNNSKWVHDINALRLRHLKLINST
jgi:radical SAM protein with 4Fe4S-binding SPASM domain